MIIYFIFAALFSSYIDIITFLHFDIIFDDYYATLPFLRY